MRKSHRSDFVDRSGIAVIEFVTRLLVVRFLTVIVFELRPPHTIPRLRMLHKFAIPVDAFHDLYRSVPANCCNAVGLTSLTDDGVRDWLYTFERSVAFDDVVVM